ncbi:MAG: DUF362 domain-containing protein [Candidatus Bathyarchaeia archaeon]
MPKVSIVKGPASPDSKTILDMVKGAVGLVGGLDGIVEEGDTVALKPNIVTGRLSGRGVTTDPRVVEALIKLAFEAGAGMVLVVEGSGYGSPTPEAFALSGIREAAEANGADVVDVDADELVEVEVPDPLILDRVSVSRRFYEADVRVNVPVMKTHDQMLMTLGMKNLKGIIPKPQKRLFHRVGLAKAIVDLNKAVPLDLTVVDAVHAMEGLGPSFGGVVEMDVIMASVDVYSLDVVGAQIMGFPPGEVEYLKLASEQGLVDLDGSDIEVVGETVSAVARSFERPPMDLAPQEGVTVIERGACSACRGTIRSVFHDLEQMGRLGEVRDLVIVVGPKAELPEGPERESLIMGTCLGRLADEGRYVLGCPPNNDKMIEAIKEICNL